MNDHPSANDDRSAAVLRVQRAARRKVLAYRGINALNVVVLAGVQLVYFTLLLHGKFALAGAPTHDARFEMALSGVLAAVPLVAAMLVATNAACSNFRDEIAPQLFQLALCEVLVVFWLMAPRSPAAQTVATVLIVFAFVSYAFTLTLMWASPLAGKYWKRVLDAKAEVQRVDSFSLSPEQYARHVLKRAGRLA